MKKILTIIILVYGLASCASLKKEQGSEKASKEVPANNEQLRNLSVTDQFLEGKRAVYMGDYVKALAHFNRCLKDNPEHAPSMYELSRIYYLKKDYGKSSEWALKAYEAHPDDVWFLKNYIKNLKINKDYKKSAEMMQALIEKESTIKQNYYDLANIYIASKEYNGALKVYQDILDKFGFEEGVILQRKQILLNQKRPKEALAEVERLIAHDPMETRYYGMKGHIQNMMGKHDEALETYNHILTINPEDGKVHLALAGLYLSMNNIDKAHTEEIIAFNNKNLSIDDKISAIMKYFNTSQTGKKEEAHFAGLLNALISTHPDEAKAHAVYGDYLIRKGQDNEALEQYLKVLELDSTQYLIWEQCILIYNERKDYQQVQSHCKRALDLFPQHSALYYFSALSAYQLKDYSTATENCEMGMNFTYKPAQQIDFLILSGKAYCANKQYEKALEQFDQVSYIKANVAEAMAEKAYCIALMDGSATEAELNIRTALELDHTNNRYFFIYAAVLHQQGKYDQAKHWIDKSLPGTDQAQFLELAGDIYQALADGINARKFYQKALEQGGDKTRIELKMSKISK